MTPPPPEGLEFPAPMHLSPDVAAASDARSDRAAAPVPAPRRATLRFMLAHPAHWIALGFGSGLSPVAPGTVGTLWAWAAFLALAPHLGDGGWAVLIGTAAVVGWWACSVTARHLGVADPGAIVWDEILAFWLVLWLVTPAGLFGQVVAFGLFRYFDAAKPGPVGWADRLFKPHRAADGSLAIGAPQGAGILLDVLVAALCALLVIALWRAL